jgi:hypothetical protein
MHELQMRRVQCLPLKAIELRGELRARTRWEATASAVNGISDHGISDMSKVDADLVRTATLELHSHQRMGAEALQ